MKTFNRSILSLLALMASSTAWAFQKEYQGFYYELDPDTQQATLICPTDGSGNLVSPEYSGSIALPDYFYFKVNEEDEDDTYFFLSAIGDKAFYNCTNLTSVSIPSGVKTIGKDVFEGCTALTRLVIGGYVHLTDNAQGLSSFAGATNLTTMELSGRIYQDKAGAFAGMKKLEHIRLGNVDTLEVNMFNGCDAMMNVKVARRRPPVCMDASSLGFDKTNVILEIPETFTNRFQAADVWKDFPTMMEVSDYDMFGKTVYEDLDWLDWVDFRVKNDDGIWLYYKVHRPGSVFLTGVPVLNGGWISSGNYDRETIRVPQTVTHTDWGTYTVTGVDGWAFDSDMELTNIYLPNTIDSLMQQAFMSTGSLEHIDLPEGLKYIGSNCFADNSSLKGKMVIPSTVRYIDWTAFRYSQIDEFEFAEGCQLDSIGGYCWFGCPNVKELILPSNVKLLDAAAIARNLQLSRVELPDGLEEMRVNALAFNPLESFTLPGGIREFDSQCLNGVGRMDLEWGNPSSSTLKRIAVSKNNPRYDSRDNCNVIMTTVGDTLVYGCDISTIPASTKVIASSAIQGVQLKSITLPKDLKSIEVDAFQNPFTGMPVQVGSIISEITEPAGIAKKEQVKNWKDEVNDVYAFNEDMFENTKLYVPAGTKAKYQADAVWSLFKNIIEEEPITVEKVEPVVEATTTTFAEVTEETDLTNAVIDNIYVTLDTLSGDHFDADEQAIVLQSVITNLAMENIAQASDLSAALANNFNGLVVELAAGNGKVTVTTKTTGDRQLAVKVGANAAELFKQANKGEITVNYDVNASTYLYIYSVGEAINGYDEEEFSQGPNARRYVKRMVPEQKAENSIFIYSMQVAPIQVNGISVQQQSAAAVQEAFSADGRRLGGVQQGLNIVRRADGRMEKVIVK